MSAESILPSQAKTRTGQVLHSKSCLGVSVRVFSPAEGVYHLLSGFLSLVLDSFTVVYQWSLMKSSASETCV